MEEKNGYLKELNRLAPASKPEGTLVSFFCGGGGLDLGLNAAGFKTGFATDIEPSFCTTVSSNLKTIAEPHDIIELKGSYIRERMGSATVDLVAGGPPCQAFSILGQRNSIGDPRGKLVFEYARLIRELKPKAFVFENVPGILTVNKGQDWASILEFFRKTTGYELHWKMLNSADFGVPQIRKRVFIVGLRDAGLPFAFPMPTHQAPGEEDLLGSREPWLPAKLALRGVKGLPNHDIRIHCDRVRNRYIKIAPGDRDRKDHTDRIHPERPSGTVLVGSAAGGGRPFIHPTTPRHITVREAARLQSFPDWYKIRGTGTQQYRQIGNAVPPMLARAVGGAILNVLKTKRAPTRGGKVEASV